MHEQLVSVLHTALLLIAPMLLLCNISRLKRKQYPPGPMGLPIIGNLMMMNQLNHKGLAKLAQRYGGLFHLKMGFSHLMVVSGPEEARQVLQVHDIIFSGRPSSVAINYITYGGVDMAFANCGPFWREMRKLLVMHLFSNKRTETWLSVRDEVDCLIPTIAGQAGFPVNVGEQVFNLTKNVIYRAALGTKLSLGQNESLAIILQELSQLFVALNISDFIPFLNRFDPSGLNDRLVKARSALGRIIDPIIDNHMNKKKAVNNNNNNNNNVHVKQGNNVEEAHDLVDELLSSYSEDANVSELGDSQNPNKLTRDKIKAMILDVTFGATETIAWTVEWAMAELLCNPEEMKRVQQEFANVVGLARRVNESDLDKLPYFQCCIKETLRLHPPIPLLFHSTTEDVVVGGYFIPKQSKILLNAWAIGRDPNVWPDANTFKPGRFLEEGAPEYKGKSFNFIPFGSGRRSCPGMGLALYTIKLCAANLLHCFTWELLDGMKPSMDETYGLTISKASRLVAVPSPRLLCSLN